LIVVITIRATADDLPMLAPLFDAYRQFYGRPPDPGLARRFLADRLAAGEAVVFLAADDDKAEGLGFVLLYPSFNSVAARPTWILHDLFVGPAWRRQGVARVLMEAARTLAIDSGADGLSLSTGTGNLKAQSLYEALGYRRDREFFHYFLALSDHG
jgi:ribosomal protein S18 acetylase RimI-like enzyme